MTESSNIDEVTTLLHGGRLSEIFQRSVVKTFNVKGFAYRNLLVNDVMARLHREQLIHLPEVVEQARDILHRPVDIFKNVSPYKYAGQHHVAFAFAREEVIDRLDNVVGHKIFMPDEYKDYLGKKIDEVRRFGSSQHIRRAFNL